MSKMTIEIPEGHVIDNVDHVTGEVTFKADPDAEMKKIRNFEDVCKKMGLNPADYETSSTEPKTVFLNGMERLLLIHEVFRAGEYMDPNDNDQKKWFPRFDVEKWVSNPTGFRFDFSDCTCTVTGSVLGPLLWLPSQKVSDYVGRTFESEFRRVIML